jgi:cobalt-zinc-cadmium efflux system outer membrane protein
MTRRRIIAASLIALAAATGPAAALPPEPLIAEAVDASPMMKAAKAEVERARATARRLRVGEYEIVVSGSTGNHTVDEPAVGSADYTEWNAGLSRTVRLPPKRNADKTIADLEIKKAEAAYARTHRSALLEFVSIWTNWRRAYEASQTERKLAEDAQQLAAAEQQAVSLGASRQIYVDQLRADAGLLKLQADQRTIDAQNAESDLAAAFPDFVMPAKPDALSWNDARITSLLATNAADSAVVREARLTLEQMQAQTRRARLDNLPDPTLGVEFSNEFGGRETRLMATLSIPLGGRARRAAADEAGSKAAAATARLRAAEMDETRRYNRAKRAAMTASTNLKTAKAAAQTARDAMDRLRKGYAMGAVNLSDLVTSQRTLSLTEQALVDYRIAAEQAYLVLAVLNGKFGSAPIEAKK